jgi:Txe/YoeB family toxin of toxin-antitoxin system
LTKYSKQAQKDSLKLASVRLKGKTEKLLAILTENPSQSPPNFEKLKGTVTPVYSRQINLQHRLVYEVFEEKKCQNFADMDASWRVKFYL